MGRRMRRRIEGQLRAGDGERFLYRQPGVVIVIVVLEELGRRRAIVR
jgi:hypothetical protein